MRSVITNQVRIGRVGGRRRVRVGGGRRGADKRQALQYGEDEASHLAVFPVRSELVCINLRPAVKAIRAAPRAQHLAAGNKSRRGGR